MTITNPRGPAQTRKAWSDAIALSVMRDLLVRGFSTVLLATLPASAAMAKIDNFAVRVPYDIALGEASNIDELSMACQILLEGDASTLLTVDGVIAVATDGTAQGEYTLFFERGEGATFIDKAEGRSTDALSRQFLDRFESGDSASLSCRWSALRYRDTAATQPVETHTAFSNDGELVPKGEQKAVILGTSEQTGGRVVELNSDSRVFFNMRFTVGDNEAPGQSMVATTQVTGGKYAAVEGLPQSPTSYEGVIAPTEPTAKQSAEKVPDQASPRDNTPLRIRVELANLCVTKSDDWGLNGSNEDVYGSFIAHLTMTDGNGDEILEIARFVSGDAGRYRAVGSHLSYLYEIGRDEAVGIGEKSCAGKLGQVGEIVVYPFDHGYATYDEMMTQGDPRVILGGDLRDADPQFGLVAPTLGTDVFSVPVHYLPICGTCKAGRGTPKTDKWSELTKLRHGFINGVMRFDLDQNHAGNGSAYGQWHYNIDIVEN